MIFIKFSTISMKQDTGSNINLSRKNLLKNEVYNDLTVNTNNYPSEYKLHKKVSDYFNKKYLFTDKTYWKFKKVLPNSRYTREIGKNEYLILEYTKIFDETRFCSLKNQTKIYVDSCPYKNCRFTCDRGKAYEADAVLFHEADIYKETTEDMIFLKKTFSRHSNRQNQIWILWNDEAWHVQSSIDTIRFNWVSLNAEILVKIRVSII